MIERILNFQIDNMPSTESLLLVPARGQFRGIDGRTFNNNSPDLIVSRWKGTGHDIPIDVEHSTELRRPQGLPAPAVGWITALEISEDGSIYGTVVWTEEGSELITTKKYRYYSPAYLVNRDTGEIVGVRSVGLTNVPNLGVPALNYEGDEGENMDNTNLRIVCNSLGISETSTEAEVVTEINSLQARVTNAENRANLAEQKLAALEETNLKTEINSAIEKGIEDGKIAPAMRDYFVTAINTQAGLDSFKEMLSKSPKLMKSGEEVTGKPEGTETTALNSEEKTVTEMLGVSEKEYKEANK